MEIVVRKATLDDVIGIVDVHTGSEDLSSLSVRERYLRGGPWWGNEEKGANNSEAALAEELEGESHFHRGSKVEEIFINVELWMVVGIDYSLLFVPYAKG